MNRFQHALLKLSEECNEVAMVCSKIAQFGLDSVYEGESNREKLTKELIDVLGCIEYVKWYSNFQFDQGGDKHPQWSKMMDKTDKIYKYQSISEDLGYISSASYKE